QKLEAFVPDAAELAAVVEVGRSFLRVATEAVQVYRERKAQHGVVDFQELLVLARDLLRDLPEGRARLQPRYRFLMIDELQDPDRVQIELVELLRGGELTAGKLFAVGDAAQSIYRFRKAEVKLFRDLRQQVPHEGRLGLTVNFRSQPAILHFVNALFRPGPRPGGHGLEGFEPLQAHHSQVNPEPCIELLWS